MATLAFENAVRLHEDAILLFGEDRIPSSLHTSALSIEELGKYYLIEEFLFQSIGGVECTEEQLQEWLQMSFSHVAKQRWFARRADHTFVSQTLIGILRSGKLEVIKQKSTYVGFPRTKKGINFDKKVRTPFRTSRKRTMDFLTAVNDYLIVLSLATRKGVYIGDFAVPEIDDWLAEQSFEQHFRELWPHMRPSTKRHITKIEKLEDDPER
jgi:AbiV family abortive infection protein